MRPREPKLKSVSVAAQKVAKASVKSDIYLLSDEKEPVK